eukprot:232321-Pyramimonas_sp.AAC.1
MPSPSPPAWGRSAPPPTCLCIPLEAVGHRRAGVLGLGPLHQCLRRAAKLGQSMGPQSAGLAARVSPNS